MVLAFPDPHTDFNDRLRFEMLLTELSARFVSVTAETIQLIATLRAEANP